MATVSFKISQQFCGECSLAIRRFVGGMDGVRDVVVEQGGVAILFDEGKVAEEQVRKVTRESIERLGYRVEEEDAG